MTSIYLIFNILIFIFVNGCAAQKRNCPPIATTTEASTILKEYSAALKPFKATGNSKMSYTNEKGETFSQAFPVRIWYISNEKYCLYGDVMFDPKGMSFAVNGGKYWLYAKPYGVYTTGRIEKSGTNYLYEPAAMLDFLEPTGISCNKIYIARPEKDFNILMCGDSEIYGTKKIFMEQCSRHIRKIEYLNCSGNLVLSVEADEYKKVSGAGFSFPHKLVYRYFRNQKCIDMRQIKLDSVKLWQPEPQQVEALFTPPDANEIKKETK